MECSSEKIAILKEESLEKWNIKIYYKFTLDNFDINDIMISDKLIENEISKSLNNINTNNITITKMIWEIISYKIKETEYIQQWSNNIIITVEDFEKYLNIIPDDMAEWNNKIITEFKINGISFIWNYNITSKKLWPINFKYNEKNSEYKENTINKENLQINNFELYLTQDNQNQINEFSIDPIAYIKNINPQSVQNYEKLKYK